MDTGLKRFRAGDKNGGSQAVLVTFQKILDPTSVVRESEYARTTEGQALISRIEGYAIRLAQGGTTLTDPELAAMVQTAREMHQQMASWSAGTRRRIETQSKKFGLDPATVFDDVLTGAPESPLLVGTPQPQTPSRSQQQKDAARGAGPKPAPRTQITVTAPDGSVHPFATQAEADAFRASWPK